VGGFISLSARKKHMIHRWFEADWAVITVEQFMHKHARAGTYIHTTKRRILSLAPLSPPPPCLSLGRGMPP
jgi:hypothetical protein